MLTLTIQGKDVGELYANVANMLVLLARGGNAVFAPQPSADGVAAEPTPPGETTSVATPEPNPPAVEKPAKQTRKPKAPPVTIEAEVVDDDPLGLNDAAPVAEPEAEKDYTIDDCKQRVKDILEKQGATKDTIASIQKLLVPFNIKKAGDLKPEQFRPFMAQSLPYLNGTAK